jgi:hypothetical protein
MLVISMRPHRSFRRLVYGSNDEELLRRAPWLVLLVHGRQAHFLVFELGGTIWSHNLRTALLTVWIA